MDAAKGLVSRMIPEPSDDDVRRAIVEAQRIMASKGLTQVHDAGADAREIRLFQEMARAGELDVRLYVMLAEHRRWPSSTPRSTTWTSSTYAR